MGGDLPHFLERGVLKHLWTYVKTTIVSGEELIQKDI